MNGKNAKSETAILRQKAENLLESNPSKHGTQLSEVEMRRFIHELEVHQIELEMQNEELVLEKGQSGLSFQKYIDLKDSMPTEEELQKNNLRFELAMRAAKMAWWKMDSTIGNVTFGRRKAEMLGFPLEKFKHCTDFMALIHPEDYDRMMAMQEHLNGSIDKYETEYRILTKSNGYQWFYDIGSVVKKDTEGKPLIVTGLVINISNRKQAEESHIASEKRYRRLFEPVKDGILILDAETGMITDVNPFLIEMLGYSEDQFLDKAIWEIGFLKDIVANLDKFSELQQKEYVRYDDLPLETADGRKISVEFISNSYFENNKKVIQCNIREKTIRRQAELALRNSETLLRTLVQSIPDLIWLKGTNGVYISCNPMLERFFGARKADIIGKTDYDFVDRELANFFRVNDRKAIEAGKSASNEEWITFADNGHRTFLDTIKTPIYDSDGTLLGILGIGRDITERKLAGQVLQASEKRFRAIFDQAPIAIALIDLQGCPIITNLRLTKMIGYSSDELAKMMFTEFTYPEDVDKDLNQFTDLIAGKISGYSMGKRYIHKNGTSIWANLFVTTLNDNNGLPKEIIGMVEDITERKKAENALFESEKKYRAFFENSMDAILLTSSDGKTLSVNQAACSMFGFSEDELINRGRSGVEDSTDPRLSVLIAERNRNGKARGEVFLLRKYGTSFPAEILTSLFKNQESHLRASTIIRDITERKKAQQDLIRANTELVLQNGEKEKQACELIEAKEKAEESDRLKSAFLANMSHEVRTPLNSIIGFSELLSDPDFDEDKKNEFIQHIIANGNNLLTIISDIMDISKLESGEITIRKSQINAYKFIENVKEKFSFQTVSTNLELKLIHSENNCEIFSYADQERLNQIFNNLISNAFKFTANGKIEIGFQSKGKRIEFFIRDTGIGISAEYHTKIFERFRQVDNSTTRKFGGNGLGLAISKKLVELMGGKIWLISEPGKGAIFHFTLPAYSSEMSFVQLLKIAI